jgi:hypothetical protein
MEKDTNQKIEKYTYKRRIDAQERINSARTLIKLLLSPHAEITPDHRKEALRLALWKITEAESPKYNLKRASTL